MANSPIVTVELSGPRGPADLADFANVVNALRNSLKNICRCATGIESLEYDVTDLRFGGAIIEAAPPPEQFKLGMAVADLLDNTVQALENSLPLDPRIDYQAVHALNGFSGIARKAESKLKLGGISLGERYATTIASLLEPNMKSLGSVTGRLEGITIHGTNGFALYPPVAGEQVECLFRSSELRSVLNALARNVTVYGTLHYAETKSFPVRVDVDTFETIEEEKLPTLLNACGVLRSSASSVDTIREMRDGWN